MTVADWLIVVLLNGAVIGYGFYLARRRITSEEWFLGGRRLAWWAIGLSMFATNVDNADLVSVTGTAFKEGVHIATVHTLGTAVGAVIAAFWVVPAICRAGLYTNAEYLEERFGPGARVLSALIQLQYRSSMLGLMIWSVHLLLTRLVGLSPQVAWALVVLLVLLVGLYTAWGGLRAVVLTDSLQGVIILLGAVVVFEAVRQAVGGWSGAVERLSEISPGNPGGSGSALDIVRISGYRGDDGATPTLVVVLGWVIIACGYWTVNHTQTMRLMGARSQWDMRMAAVFGAALSVPILAASVSIGVFARALYPDFAVADELYPFLADRFLGPGLRGIVVAGVVAAAISTFDSMGSALSAIFTRDIYARLLVTRRDDAHYVRVSRWATLGILSLGFLYIPFIRSKDTMLQAFLTLIPVFVTPLFTIYLVGVWTRAPSVAGTVGLAVGAVYGLVALIDREFADIAWLPPWFTGRWSALAWSVVFTSGAAAVAAVVAGSCRGGATPASGEDSRWIAASRARLAPLPAHPFRERVPLLLRPEGYAVALIASSAYVVFVFLW